MLGKTRGIVLHQIRYTDSGIVANLFTREYGRLSFLVKGMRNRKTGKHNILFQPMFILDLEMYYKPMRDLQTVKEFSSAFTPFDIYSNIRKTSVAIFLGEVLNSVIKEETPHEELFTYIEESVFYFENCRDDYANFHISFLANLGSFLGFEPERKRSAEDLYFDLVNGVFVQTPPLHGTYAGKEISAYLSSFFTFTVEESKNISLNGTMRNSLLETLMRYYSIHLPGLKKIKSLDVLKEVFS